MDWKDTSEYAYKNGYEKGFQDGKESTVRHGKWIDLSSDERLIKIGCSQCGADILQDEWKHQAYSNYCPNCGADMWK